MNYPSAMQAYSAAMELVSLARSDGGLTGHKSAAAKRGWVVSGYASYVMFGEDQGVMRMSALKAEDLQVASSIQELMREVGGKITYGNDIIDAIDKFRSVMVEFLEWFYAEFLNRVFEQ